ncbi:MAG: hypothetical protein HY260_12295 [Chloroflexi bacterium]|nr:hypothetical protein [Chloroflexota bacterium]
MNPDSPMRKFDPRRLAQYEKENYVAYYQKSWLKLLRVSVAMVKEAFGLSLPQTVYGAYLVARAEVAFAPFPDNDIPKAEAYMRRFYAFIQRVHREEFDVGQAAKLEVNWWIVHRELFANAENGPLVDALADLWAQAYGVPIATMRQAAYHRALGILASDRWVRAGKPMDGPLLAEEEEELFKGYAALREAIT